MNDMKKARMIIVAALCLSALYSCRKEQPPVQQRPLKGNSNTWQPLLDTGLSKWEKFIGVPHYTVTLPFDHPKGDGMNGTPLGIGNDPLGVFTTYTDADGTTILKISGEIYGGLTTTQEYGDYHLVAQFKWGEKKYDPRLAQKRDNGILYHCYGGHGAFWNVWMNSQEYQVQEADMGDYFALGPMADIAARYDSLENEHDWIYDPAAPLHSFGGTGPGRCRRSVNAELPHGQWNKLELICLGDSSIHVVNGKVVLRLKNSRNNNGALTKGKIQIQSEGAECYYRGISIQHITSIPEIYR